MKHGEIIGIGNTAVIYEWEKDKVLKLFNKDFPKESKEREFHNALAIQKLDFGKPRIYETIDYEGQSGIIYERLEGESLLEQVLKTGELKNCAIHMANLHKAILKYKISDVPDYKVFLKDNIEKISPAFAQKREEALTILDKLPEGDNLCHGDFHPGNIIISKGTAKVIDFMNICRGDYLYDVARTVYLVEYTPVPDIAEEKETLLQFKRTLADLYLLQMKVTREMIQDYLTVISAARIIECPNESINP